MGDSEEGEDGNSSSKESSFVSAALYLIDTRSIVQNPWNHPCMNKLWHQASASMNAPRCVRASRLSPPLLFYYRCDLLLLFSQREQTWPPAEPAGLSSLVSAGNQRWLREARLNETWSARVFLMDAVTRLLPPPEGNNRRLSWAIRRRCCCEQKPPPVDSLLDIHRVSTHLSIFNKSADKRPSQRTELNGEGPCLSWCSQTLASAGY